MLDQSVKDKLIKPIKDFIKEKQADSKIILNKILRDDVFSLLSNNAIIFYYPSTNKHLDGFHVTRFVNGVPKNFVYINTSKDIEKQVFTAAHELGHIWKLDIWLLEKRILPKRDIETKIEDIMDFFAAELLMERKTFEKEAGGYFKDYISKSGSTVDIPEKDLILIAVRLMNSYMVPFESVLRRLIEMNIISANVDVHKYCKKKKVIDLIESYKQFTVTRLSKQSNIKGVGGDSLIRNLLYCKDNNLIDPYKLNLIAQDFGIDIDKLSAESSKKSVSGITINEK